MCSNVTLMLLTTRGRSDLNGVPHLVAYLTFLSLSLFPHVGAPMSGSRQRLLLLEAGVNLCGASCSTKQEAEQNSILFTSDQKHHRGARTLSRPPEALQVCLAACVVLGWKEDTFNEVSQEFTRRPFWKCSRKPLGTLPNLWQRIGTSHTDVNLQQVPSTTCACVAHADVDP